MNKYKYVILFGLCLQILCLFSCKGELHEKYTFTHDAEIPITVSLLDWHISGPYTLSQDTQSYSAFISPRNELTKHENDSAVLSEDFTPAYGQVDLKEFYKISSDSVFRKLENQITYLSHNLTATDDMTLYLEIRHAMPLTLWLNGDSIYRRDIQGLNIYRLPLKKGNNRLAMRAEMQGEDWSFDARVCDSLSVVRIFAEGQSCNILFPLVRSDIKTVMLTNAHQNVLDMPVTIELTDVYGVGVGRATLLPDSFTYRFPQLRKDVSYMCTMRMGKTTMRQPVLCGKDDDAFARFETMRHAIPDTHPRAAEIDGLLFRLKYLLTHPSRYEGDWWWQFKISPLTYQLEHTFAHLQGNGEYTITMPNVSFVTYRSSLDNGFQRYVLITPDVIDFQKPIPLVVSMRADLDAHRHFFSSPQLSRQWSINLAQGFANRCQCAIVIPEMRFYGDEDLTPMAEAELQLAIKDIQRKYPIDSERIYLHGVCSGGYRALRMAIQHPNMFAAIGLYTPTYEGRYATSWSVDRAPERFIQVLKPIPMFVHYDPLDAHNPYSMFESLVDDAKRFDISLELSVIRNSGRYYNMLNVGEEAMSFFQGKKRKLEHDNLNPEVQKDLILADFYSRPFVYVYDSSNQESWYLNLVDSIRNEYRLSMFTEMPLISDLKVDKAILNSKNIFMIGSRFRTAALNDIARACIEENGDRYINHGGAAVMSVHKNYRYGDKTVILYTSDPFVPFSYEIQCPWKEGLFSWIDHPIHE